MTKKELEQALMYVHEIKAIEKSIESPIAAYANVLYTASETDRKPDKGQTQIRILIGNLTDYKKKLAEQRAKAEQFIDSIEDDEARTILQLYYISGNTQEEIGYELHFSQSVVSEKMAAFWRKHERKAKEQ